MAKRVKLTFEKRVKVIKDLADVSLVEFNKATAERKQKLVKNLEIAVFNAYRVFSVDIRLALGRCPDGWFECPPPGGGCAPTRNECP